MKLNMSLTFEQVFPKGAFLAEVKPWYRYANNVRTDERMGTIYVLVNRIGYDKIPVRVPSTIPVISNEEIEASSEDIKVVAEGFRGKIYNSPNGAGITAEAKEVVIENE